MNEEVKYTLTLNDMLTNKLEGADIAAKGLEGTMSLIGIAGGVFALGSFLEGSVEMFNEADQASAQLNATLESTKNIAGLNREALDAQAESIMNQSLFDDDAITGAQDMLATFTNIRGAVYNDAIPAIADLATKMGGDLQGASIQVGKALNDPTKGIQALSRVGVSFSQSQKDVIENLQKTGHLAEAQGLILKELQTEFGGSALAASEAGTGGFTVLQHQMGNVREEIGGMVVAAGQMLLPALHGLVDGIGATVEFLKESWHWVTENKELFKALAVGIGVTTGAYLLYNLQQKAVVAWQVLQEMWTMRTIIAENLLQASTYLLSLSFTEMGISAEAAWGLATAGISLAIIGFYELWQHSETFRNAIRLIWVDVKILGEGLAYMWHMASRQFDKASEDLKGMNALLAERKSLIDGTYNENQGKEVVGGKTFSMLDYGKDKGKKGLMPLDAEKVKDVSPKGATGTKAVTINISIGKLIESFNIKTTNIQESTAKITELVATALTSAVNDSQVTAAGI